MTAEAEEASDSYKKGNHILRVYHFPHSFNLRSSPDMRNKANNVLGQLETGDLFYISDFSRFDRIYTNWNYPRNNVSKYHATKINVFEEGRRVERFARVSFEEFLLKEGESMSKENRIQSQGGIFGRSLPFIDWIRWELVQNGWNKKDTFKSGHFAYTAGGYYSTILRQGVTVYNRYGEAWDVLEAGSRIFATMNLPFATGYNDPTKIRIVGFTRNGTHEYVETVGTIFIDGIKGNRRTVETLSEG